MIAALDRAVSGIERLGTFIAAGVMFAIMIIVSADVLMRYGFNRPFGWAYDLIGMYLMVALFYLVLSRAFAAHAHVNVDILLYTVPARGRRALELIICAASAVLFLAVTIAGAERTWTSYVNAEEIAGSIAWPAWLAVVFVPIGAGLLTLRLVLQAVSHAASLASGRDIVPLTPLAGSPEAMEREHAE
jgi:TRAP-type C4-dicarboxylate transport system permease small subunit